MARGDDLINLIIALADMIGTVAKNMKKSLSIIRSKSTDPTIVPYAQMLVSE